MGRAGLRQVAALADPFLEPLSVIPSGVARSAQLRLAEVVPCLWAGWLTRLPQEAPDGWRQWWGGPALRPGASGVGTRGICQARGLSCGGWRLRVALAAKAGAAWGPPASPVLLLCPPVSEAFPPSAVAALAAPSLEDIWESGAIV